MENAASDRSGGVRRTVGIGRDPRNRLNYPVEFCIETLGNVDVAIGISVECFGVIQLGCRTEDQFNHRGQPRDEHAV